MSISIIWRVCETTDVPHPTLPRGGAAKPAGHSLGLLQFLGPLDGIRLVLAPPLGHLGIGLGQQPLQLGLGLSLLLMLLP